MTERYGASPASKTVVNTPAAQSQPASQSWVWNILNVFNILNRARQTVTTWNPWSSVRTIWTPWWLRR